MNKSCLTIIANMTRIPDILPTTKKSVILVVDCTVRKNRLSFTYEFRFVFQLGSPMLKVVATEVEVKTTTCKLPQLPPLPWQLPRPEGPEGQLPPPR